MAVTQSLAERHADHAARHAARHHARRKPPASARKPAMTKPTSRPDATRLTPAAASHSRRKPTLQPATFADLPGWESDDHLAAFKTFLKSCDAVIKAAASPAPSRRDARPSVGELADACRAAQALEVADQGLGQGVLRSRSSCRNRVVHKDSRRAADGLLRAGARGLAHARRASSRRRSTGARPIS